MTPELIDQWARESAGPYYEFDLPALSKFAALVAAHQRELDAKVCQDSAEKCAPGSTMQIYIAACAAAIRGTK